MLTSDQIATIRGWISDRTPPTDPELDAMYSRLESLKAVVQEVLRKRLAEFTAKPSQFAVAGDYSQSTAANINGLREQLKLLDQYTDDLVFSPASSQPLTVQRMRRRAVGRR